MPYGIFYILNLWSERKYYQETPMLIETIDTQKLYTAENRREVKIKNFNQLWSKGDRNLVGHDTINMPEIVLEFTVF